jgi:hypothetical protein
MRKPCERSVKPFLKKNFKLACYSLITGMDLIHSAWILPGAHLGKLVLRTRYAGEETVIILCLLVISCSCTGVWGFEDKSLKGRVPVTAVKHSGLRTAIQKAIGAMCAGLRAHTG